MKKRLFAFALMLLLIMSLCVPALAATRASVTPSLSFSGTTANCRTTISAPQEKIVATLELWKGNTLVDSWSKSGTSYVSISGTHRCDSGSSYTVKVTGTISGSSFSSTGMTSVCP